MRTIPLLVASLLISCAAPSGVKVIVGAQLDTGRDQKRLQNSVIVIRDGKFETVGPQALTPVPKGAEITSGYGKVVTPTTENGLIAAGEPADLVLRNAATKSAERIMHDGEWTQ